MVNNVSRHGRKMVTIVDPHLKRDEKYYIHTEATKLGFYIKDKDGKDFDGWCWPGQSSYLDFTNPKVLIFSEFVMFPLSLLYNFFFFAIFQLIIIYPSHIHPTSLYTTLLYTRCVYGGLSSLV